MKLDKLMGDNYNLSPEYLKKQLSKLSGLELKSLIKEVNTVVRQIDTSNEHLGDDEDFIYNYVQPTINALLQKRGVK